MTKRSWTVAVALALSMFSCNKIAGSGTAKTEKRTVGEFTEVTVSTGIEADIDSGALSPLEITCDDNLLAKVKTEVSDHHLKIWIDGMVAAKTPIVVHVTTPKLTSLEARSGATLKATGIAGDAISIDASSGSHITASGSAKTASVDGTSGSTVNAGELVVAKVDAKFVAGSDLTVNATESVGGSGSSGAHLHIKGNPTSKSVSTSSGASVN